jgi:hypothetical protein
MRVRHRAVARIPLNPGAPGRREVEGRSDAVPQPAPCRPTPPHRLAAGRAGAEYNRAVPDPVPGVRLLEVLREDAVGTYQRAEDATTGEPLCARRLHGHLCGDEAARLVFAEEVRRVATLDHPRLLRVRRHDARAEVPWILADAVHGETLEAALARGAWEPARARAFALEALSAFALLEKRRQFHAAPVPSRIVRVAHDWRFLTFRDVRAEDEAPRLKGRPPDPAWSAPELAEARPDPAKARSLTPWAVGALWHACLTGRPPPRAGVTPDDLAAAGPDAATLARLLDPSPHRRPDGADACLAWIEGRVPRPGGAPPPIAPLVVKRRRPT